MSTRHFLTGAELSPAELQSLLQRRSFRFGDFLLSSGRRSDFYFDGKQVTLEGRGLYLTSRLILDRCRERNSICHCVGSNRNSTMPVISSAAAS